MFYKQIEKNEITGRFHIVTVEELKDGQWSYVRKAGGLTLKTQDLKYYFQGLQDKGYKTEFSAKKALEKIKAE